MESSDRLDFESTSGSSSLESLLSEEEDEDAEHSPSSRSVAVRFRLGWADRLVLDGEEDDVGLVGAVVDESIDERFDADVGVALAGRLLTVFVGAVGVSDRPIGFDAVWMDAYGDGLLADGSLRAGDAKDGLVTAPAGVNGRGPGNFDMLTVDDEFSGVGPALPVIFFNASAADMAGGGCAFARGRALLVPKSADGLAGVDLVGFFGPVSINGTLRSNTTGVDGLKDAAVDVGLSVDFADDEEVADELNDGIGPSLFCRCNFVA